MNRKHVSKAFLALACAALAFSLTACSGSKQPEVNVPPWLEDVPENEEFLKAYANPVEGNSHTSIFCWDDYLLNDGCWDALAEPLRQLGITRVYQELLPEQLGDLQTVQMVQRLEKMGIETALLTGDADWLWDGDEELYALLDALAAYNEGIGKDAPIQCVAIDAESYVRSAWKEKPVSSFQAFIEMMSKARIYANELGIRVVQVVPSKLDLIDQGLFVSFVRQCCDELSVMNYTRSNNLAAIWNETAVCRQYDVPIEGLFETMRNNEHYAVTEEKTWFYDGAESMQGAVEQLRETYGGSMGVGYHYYNTVRHVLNGGTLVRLYPYSRSSDSRRTENGQPQSIGSLLLKGDDGSLLQAHVYWPGGKQPDHEYCWLAVGVMPDVTYTLEILDEGYTTDATFTLKERDASSESKHITVKRIK